MEVSCGGEMREEVGEVGGSHVVEGFASDGEDF